MPRTQEFSDILIYLMRDYSSDIESKHKLVATHIAVLITAEMAESNSYVFFL